MAKGKGKKEPTPRAEQYDAKLAVNGTFEQVIQASFLGKPPVKQTKKQTDEK